ncbi:MAG TPA: S24/S26 family peptidase [bacterium]|nr:S24/S26 family peptidase [bacterium]
MPDLSLDQIIATFSAGGVPGAVLFGSQNSMLPSITPGELVHIAPVQRDRLMSGDVVVFRAGEVFVAHRLIWKRGFVARTKGDNNPYCDRPISVFDIVGVVEGKRSRRAMWYYLLRNRLRHYTPRPVRSLFSSVKKSISDRKRLL